nr:hypothetical protein [Tanacetum cinerariifolium]
MHQEKLIAVKARLNFEEASQYSESESRTEEKTSRNGWDPGVPEPVHKPRTKARLFQITKGEGSEKKDGVQKIEESSRRDTESCYQSSRSKKTKIASEKHRPKREYSRRTEAGSESEGSAGGTGSQNQRSKSQAWRMTYPNHRVWFDDLKESIDSYDDLRKAILENYLQ